MSDFIYFNQGSGLMREATFKRWIDLPNVASIIGYGPWMECDINHQIHLPGFDRFSGRYS